MRTAVRFGPFVIPMLTNVRVRSPSNSNALALNEMSLLLRKFSSEFFCGWRF